MTKQEILEQIKRVAANNGGATPGMDSFHSQTGVKYYDWFGVYWPRWSDAVKEAGLTPNQMKVGYEETFLIMKIIELAREVGRFPVKGDFRLKAFKEKGFPNDKTFDRLGPKREQISIVERYCREKDGFEDVALLCELALSKTRKVLASDAQEESLVEIGLVYLIKSGRFYKIGKTKSIGRREYDLAIQLAEKPITIHVIKTDDPDGIESYWHRRFAAKRKNGEWFDLAPADVKAFKRWLRIV